MPAQKSVLFLSAYVGTGHTSAAEAVKEAIETLNPDVKTLIVDSYAYVSSIFGKIASQGYIQLVRFFPQLYNILYELRNSDSAVAAVKSRFTQVMAGNLKALIRDFKPQVLVCTHAFPSGAASLLKQELGLPLVNIITDFTVHPFWIHPNADLYLVGSSHLVSLLEERGIEPGKIKVTGIPVSPKFSASKGRFPAKQRLGLDSALKTVLIMGGGAGLGPIGWILRSLRKAKFPLQVLVVTGVNHRLRKRLESYAGKLNSSSVRESAIKEIRVYGYVKNVDELMKVSDLLITKPGGLTSSEALVAELPIVIVRPLPGPEVRNAQYLVREKAAVLVKKEKDVAGVVDSLLGNVRKIEELKERTRMLKRPDAAFEAAKCILSLV